MEADLHVPGLHQAGNAALAVVALRRLDDAAIAPAELLRAVREGLAGVRLLSRGN